MSEEKELPSPRFDVVNRIFDKIDSLLEEEYQENTLSIFEFEILMLMLKKKIDHIGIMTALQLEGGGNPSEGNKGSPDVYK